MEISFVIVYPSTCDRLCPHCFGQRSDFIVLLFVFVFDQIEIKVGLAAFSFSYFVLFSDKLFQSPTHARAQSNMYSILPVIRNNLGCMWALIHEMRNEKLATVVTNG